MNKREFVQDTAQKLLLQAFSTVPGDRTERAIKAITRAADMLAHELEVSGNGWGALKIPARPRPVSTEVQCNGCGGRGRRLGSGISLQCDVCGGTGKLIIDMPPRRP